MPVDSINAHWAGAFQVITDTGGWQHFRRLDPALLISPATDGLEDRAPTGAGIRASWTASSGTLFLEAEGTADSSPFDVLADGKLAHRVPAAGRVSYGLALGTLKPGTSVQLWLPRFGTGRIHEASLRGRGSAAGDGVRQTLADVRQLADALLQQLPAEFISLCLGINAYNAAVFSERSYASQVLGFLANIRKAHPLAPVAVITPMLSLPREELPNAVGMT